jgi:hypothetical protein
MLSLPIYLAVMCYSIDQQRMLCSTSTRAVAYQQRLAERKKAGKYSLSKEDHKKLNWMGISASVFLLAITVINEFKK